MVVQLNEIKITVEVFYIGLKDAILIELKKCEEKKYQFNFYKTFNKLIQTQGQIIKLFFFLVFDSWLYCQFNDRNGH